MKPDGARLSFVPVADPTDRNAKAKPSFGEFRRLRHERRRAIETYLKHEKAKAKARDGYQCRWPGCDCRTRRVPLESAHLVDLSLGGSNDASNIVTLCADRHRGTPSLHSKDLKIEALDPLAGANGLLAFYRRHPETGEWLHVGTEKRIGVMETRR